MRPPVELLEQARLASYMTDPQAARLLALHLELQLDSTNSRALQALPTQGGRGIAWFAEQQLAGRGRRGRHWVSGFASDLTFSLAWRFDLPLAQLSGLSLAAGVVLCEVLGELGLDGHGLKWPNDILLDGRKLAGILVEAVGESGGPACVVIGIGINIGLPDAVGQAVEQAWTSLHEQGVPVSRNQLAGHLLGALSDACEQFSRLGPAPFVERWREHDLLAGLPLRLHFGDRVIEGRSKGVTDDGGLALETLEGVQTFYAGEVTLRGMP
jgi:BirA family biotin operon repressor/biotin-[acetyl-CoA-carboxylase] ligase